MDKLNASVVMAKMNGYFFDGRKISVDMHQQTTKRNEPAKPLYAPPLVQAIRYPNTPTMVPPPLRRPGPPPLWPPPLNPMAPQPPMRFMPVSSISNANNHVPFYSIQNVAEYAAVHGNLYRGFQQPPSEEKSTSDKTTLQKSLHSSSTQDYNKMRTDYGQNKECQQKKQLSSISRSRSPPRDRLTKHGRDFYSKSRSRSPPRDRLTERGRDFHLKSRSRSPPHGRLSESGRGLHDKIYSRSRSRSPFRGRFTERGRGIRRGFDHQRSSRGHYTRGRYGFSNSNRFEDKRRRFPDYRTTLYGGREGERSRSISSDRTDKRRKIEIHRRESPKRTLRESPKRPLRDSPKNTLRDSLECPLRESQKRPRRDSPKRPLPKNPVQETSKSTAGEKETTKINVVPTTIVSKKKVEQSDQCTIPKEPKINHLSNENHHNNTDTYNKMDTHNNVVPSNSMSVAPNPNFAETNSIPETNFYQTPYPNFCTAQPTYGAPRIPNLPINIDPTNKNQDYVTFNIKIESVETATLDTPLQNPSVLDENLNTKPPQSYFNKGANGANTHTGFMHAPKATTDRKHLLPNIHRILGEVLRTYRVGGLPRFAYNRVKQIYVDRIKTMMDVDFFNDAEEVYNHYKVLYPYSEDFNMLKSIVSTVKTIENVYEKNPVSNEEGDTMKCNEKFRTFESALSKEIEIVKKVFVESYWWSEDSISKKVIMEFKKKGVHDFFKFFKTNILKKVYSLMKINYKNQPSKDALNEFLAQNNLQVVNRDDKNKCLIVQCKNNHHLEQILAQRIIRIDGGTLLLGVFKHSDTIDYVEDNPEMPVRTSKTRTINDEITNDKENNTYSNNTKPAKEDRKSTDGTEESKQIQNTECATSSMKCLRKQTAEVEPDIINSTEESIKTQNTECDTSTKCPNEQLTEVVQYITKCIEKSKKTQNSSTKCRPEELVEVVKDIKKCIEESKQSQSTECNTSIEFLPDENAEIESDSTNSKEESIKNQNAECDTSMKCLPEELMEVEPDITNSTEKSIKTHNAECDTSMTCLPEEIADVEPDIIKCTEEKQTQNTEFDTSMKCLYEESAEAEPENTQQIEEYNTQCAIKDYAQNPECNTPIEKNVNIPTTLFQLEISQQIDDLSTEISGRPNKNRISTENENIHITDELDTTLVTNVEDDTNDDLLTEINGVLDKINEHTSNFESQNKINRESENTHIKDELNTTLVTNVEDDTNDDMLTEISGVLDKINEHTSHFESQNKISRKSENTHIVKDELDTTLIKQVDDDTNNDSPKEISETLTNRDELKCHFEIQSTISRESTNTNIYNDATLITQVEDDDLEDF